MGSQDVFTVRERVYQNALQKAWSNGEIDVVERKSLNIIADLLKLPAERRRELEWAACSAVFSKALSLAFSGDHVTDEDCKSLTTIAAGYGKTASALLKQSFETETSSFLGRQLNRLSSGGKFGTEEWKILVSTATRLGLSESDLRSAVFDQSKALVEKLLAYSKSDGVVTKQEYEELIWLVETLGMPPEVRSYVDAEVAAVNAIEKIREGHLPTVPAPRSGLQLKAGEILHHFGPGYFQRTRYRRAGEHTEQHQGTIAVTDTRLVFASATAGVDLSHRRVLKIELGRSYADVQASSKGSGCYHFVHEPEKAVLIYQAAIARANQTLVAQTEGAPTRHISRDVRQRVWQTYGGKCAECGDNSYIEYDHIIPHAKGGSNDERNIQLLCRKCNLKKSDNI